MQEKTGPSPSVIAPGAIAIRPYAAADTGAVGELFRASVQGLAARDYTPSQLRAWAPDLTDDQEFGERCRRRSTWVAEIEGRIAGFSDLNTDGHVDMLYVHPDFARRGVASALLRRIEQAARATDIRRLYTEASMTARAVFEKAGFRVIVPQAVTVRGEAMINYRMEKRLEL